MPVYSIPNDAEPYLVVQGSDGGFAVVPEKVATSGTEARDVLLIPCRDEAQARMVCDRLNRREHDGTIQVDLLSLPASDDSEPEPA